MIKVRIVRLAERVLLPAAMALAVRFIERRLNKAIRGRHATRRREQESGTGAG